jgi:hypothetical protein
MAYEIISRGRRGRESLEDVKTSAGSDQSRTDLRRPGLAANDNDLAWPLIPFPEGWYGA